MVRDNILHICRPVWTYRASNGGGGMILERHYVTHSKIIEAFALNGTCKDTAVRTGCT